MIDIERTSQHFDHGWRIVWKKCRVRLRSGIFADGAKEGRIVQVREQRDGPGIIDSIRKPRRIHARSELLGQRRQLAAIRGGEARHCQRTYLNVGPVSAALPGSRVLTDTFDDLVRISEGATSVVYRARRLSDRQKVILKQGIDSDTARKIVKLLKESGLKVQAQIQGEKVRVIGKKRDDLQMAIAHLRRTDVGVPLQFENFRD